jgi:uncharacterized protein YkwD
VVAAAAPAAAAPLTLQAVNGRGVEQASLVDRAGQTYATNGHGQILLDVAPGEQLLVRRGEGAPEGAGVPYTVPNPVPPGPVPVVLASLLMSTAPAHDAAEAWLLARVNELRAAHGLAPLQQSGPLNRASDGYARPLSDTGQFDHRALATPWVRAVDQGWPRPGGAGVGEVLAQAPSKETALSAWQGSPSHWNLLMGADKTVTGVGRVGRVWVMMPSNCAPTDAPERCEIGQSGAPAAPAPPPPPAAAPVGDRALQRGKAKKRARLRVRVRRHGRRLRVVVRLLEGRGRLRVVVRQRQRRARVRGRQRGAVLRARTRLPRRGRWKIVVRLDGRRRWADRRLRPRSVVVRM